MIMSVATVNLEPSGVLQLCPGSNITFVCTNNQTIFLVWRSFEQGHPEGDPYFFNTGSEVDMVEHFSGSFAVVLISTNPLISTATLTKNFGLQLNGANLTCFSTTSTNPSPSDWDYAVLTLKGTQNTCTVLFSFFFLSVHVCMCGVCWRDLFVEGITSAVVKWLESFYMTTWKLPLGKVILGYNTEYVKAGE